MLKKPFLKFCPPNFDGTGRCLLTYSSRPCCFSCYLLSTSSKDRQLAFKKAAKEQATANSRKDTEPSRDGIFPGWPLTTPVLPSPSL